MSQNQHILVLTTGGTIDKTYFDSLSKYQITESIVARLLEVARVTQPFEIVEIARKDSLELTNKDRAHLASIVRSSNTDRIVITHGTDTMSITASALARIPNKTIVLTGALAPARFSESDAAFNIGMAFATCQTARPGVYITMNGTVFPGDDVMKDRTLGTFVRNVP